MADGVDWPALIGVLIQIKSEIDQLDEEQLEDFTLPRVAASEAELSAFEESIGERLPDGYRDFLLASNGWPKFYFELDLFGLPELGGGGSWRFANAALTVYDEEGVLEDAGLDVDGVVPVAAGEGMRDLVVVVRNGLPEAGQVSWLDGEELGRYANFAEYFTAVTEMKRRAADRLRAGTA